LHLCCILGYELEIKDLKVDGGDEGWDNTEISRRDIRSET